MPVQLTLRSPKGGRVLHESMYEDGHRIDAVSGWLIVVDRNGSVVAAHAACPGLEGAVVEHTAKAAATRSQLGEILAQTVEPGAIRGGVRYPVPEPDAGERASAAARPDPSLLAGGHMPGTPIAGLDQGGYGDSYEGEDDDPVPHEPVDLRPVEEDPRRPHLDAWPDDAVLLRYRELRRLVALHLERYEATPDVVRAMLEGDVPLRVSEVLT